MIPIRVFSVVLALVTELLIVEVMLATMTGKPDLLYLSGLYNTQVRSYWVERNGTCTRLAVKPVRV